MSIAIMWFRRDLRINDNPAFYAACENHQQIIATYIEDNTTSALGSAQKWWLHHSLLALAQALKKQGISLLLLSGKSLKHLEVLIKKYSVDSVYWNRCYEPEIIKRDEYIQKILAARGVSTYTSNASLLNEPWTVKNKSGDYFKIFTPYWQQCIKQMTWPELPTLTKKRASPKIDGELLADWNLLPKKPNWALAFPEYWQPGEQGAQQKLETFLQYSLMNYKNKRDIPSENATSRLSPHLHFGEISPWQIWYAVDRAKSESDIDMASVDRFLMELGWREFSYYLLYHYPGLPDTNFKHEFNNFPWKNSLKLLKRWQKGLTGYPIIDAGMRELWQTGYMHNRIRMLVASFLVKDLLIDWRHGAAWFLDTLVDADLASNAANWQWVAGCGADAAPYFRIFNPVLQGEKFDPEGRYVRRWLPELAQVPDQWIHKLWLAPSGILPIQLGKDYPKPIIEHISARKAAMMNYQQIRKRSLP